MLVDAGQFGPGSLELGLRAVPDRGDVSIRVAVGGDCDDERSAAGRWKSVDLNRQKLPVAALL